MRAAVFIMLTLVTGLLAGCSDESAESPAATAPASSASTQAIDPDRGQQVYEHYCVHCHAPGTRHPGSAMLAALKGEEMSVIKGRPDLTSEYIKTIVRSGLIEMPPFRPTEITDAELTSLAEYVLAP